MSKQHTIAESTFSTDPIRIDVEAGVIHGVKVLGRDSRNGRVYSATALDEAARLYEGVSVCLDHPDDPHKVRSVADGWGVLRNARVAKEGVFADLHYLKNHAATAAIVERAERFPRNFGLSHNASGSIVEGRDGEPDVVESIEHVHSVDLVSRPATNSGLFESHSGGSRKMTHTVKSVLERHAKSKPDAKRLMALLEMDEYEAMSSEPVVMDDPATPEDEMAASIESLVLAVLRDDALDAAGMVGKIRQILNVKDKLSDSGSEDADDASDGSGDAEDDAAGDMAESVRRLEMRDELRDLCEEQGLAYRDLKPLQRKLLERLDTRKERKELLESLSAASHDTHRQKPRARSIVESSGNARGSYEDLLKAATSRR